MSSCCVSISNYENTLCGLNNGSITATTTSTYNPFKFYLYETTIGYITSATTNSVNYIFNSLTAGTYYVTSTDNIGCTAQSETVIILSSDELDYGLYVVNDAGCAVDSGKIFVTGLTGTPPYTYSWNTTPVQTTSSITGLSAGAYIVTVTDGSGCVKSKTGIVTEVPPLGIVSILTTDPSCFSSDGEITVVVSGGTAPYNYSATTLGNNYSFDNFFTFTNVSSGNYNILITDAGLCTTTGFITVLTPGGISIVNLTYSPSTCGSSGYVTIQVVGGSPPYTYTLTKDGGPTSTQLNGSPVTFTTLTSGNYSLTITDGGPCEYSTEFTIENANTTVVNTNITGTTCGNPNGAITVTAIGPEPSYTFTLDGVNVQTAISSVTYNTLVSGPHTITVSDANGCSQTIIENIPSSSGVDFILVGTDALGGNDGEITALITQGTPPFTWTWSPNVNGQTGLTVTTLTAGTYSLTVIDDNGCETIRTIIINGNSILTSYQVFNVCDSDLANYGELLLKGPKQMLLEGFNELTIDDENCVLNQSIFEAIVTISGITKTEQFFTGTTLDEYPTIEQWVDIIKSLILTYEGIGSVVFDIENNKITISTDCKSEISLNDVEVKVDLKIDYDISCVSCGGECNCYSIIGPKGCLIQYLDCDLQESEVLLDGTQEVKVCGKEILGSQCDNDCTNPLEYFFKKINEDFEILSTYSPEAPLLYDNFVNNYLNNSLIISNATNTVCCPDCGAETLNFYSLTSGDLYAGIYAFLGQSPTCCFNYSANTLYHNYIIDIMESYGLTPSNVCDSGFLNCLSLLENIVGTLNYNDFITNSGIYESPMTQNSTLLCSLIDALQYAKDNFGISENELYDTFINVIDIGFVSYCFNDFVFMGGAESGFETFSIISGGTIPSAVCSGLTINNVSECIDNICPSACTSPINYLFDYMSEYESSEPKVYLEILQLTLINGLIFDNSNGEYCCPDNCTGNNFYYISDYDRFGDYYQSYFSTEVIDITNCCLNHILTSESYLKYQDLTDLGYQFQPVTCCNSFEPCTEKFSHVISTKNPLTVIELSTINGFSPWCDIIDRITGLPYNDYDQIDILYGLLGVSLVIGCEGDNMFIGSTETYVNWLYPA